MDNYVIQTDPEMKFPWFSHQEMYNQCLYLVENWSNINLDTNGTMFYETDKRM